MGGGLSTGRIVTAAVAGVLIVPLLAVAVVSATYVVDDDDGPAAAEERREAAESVGAVTDALISERAWAGVALLGFSQPLSIDRAVPRTDEAIAALRTGLDEWSEDTAAPYRRPADELDDLAAIRDEVAATPDGSPADVDAAGEVGLRYDSLLGALHEASRLAVRSIDDPVERQGAQLLALVREQSWLGSQLDHMLLLFGVEGGTADTPEEIRTIAAQLNVWDAGLAEIAAAEDPYASVVAEHLPDDGAAALSALAEDVLSTGGPVDVNALLAIDVSMVDLETAVAERHAEIVARSASDAEDDEQRALMVGGVALVSALGLAVLAVVVIVTGRRSPPPGPAGPAETAAPSPPGVLSERP